MRVKKWLCTGLIIFCAGTLAAQDRIILRSSPEGAAVYWSGKRLGQTPLTITSSTPGAPNFFSENRPSFDLFLYKEFFEAEIVTVKSDGPKETLVNVSLEPLVQLPYYDGVYQKIPKLRFADVIDASLEELARLREELYARYGRPIRDERFVSYFRNTRWYRENPYYTDDWLTGVDTYNLKLINDFLEVNNNDEALFADIVRRYEFSTADKKHVIRFINARQCQVSFDNQPDFQVVPYFFNDNEIFNFKVAGGKIYIYNESSISLVTLDMKKKTLMKITHEEDINNW
ncbi:MAG TPA: YARHG domain-containing protein [Spirochaetia bacterium]|nr:YARHG domain-containing protein [Spirochaetia bacterium]